MAARYSDSASIFSVNSRQMYWDMLVSAWAAKTRVLRATSSGRLIVRFFTTQEYENTENVSTLDARHPDPPDRLAGRVQEEVRAASAGPSA